MAMIGEIRLYPFEQLPDGWAPCHGQLLPINQNRALFSLLGTTYGGNGSVTFALPDLRGRVAVGQGGTAGPMGMAARNDGPAQPFQTLVYAIALQRDYPSRP